MIGHVLNGHMAGQIQDASFKLSDETPVFLSKADLYLADRCAYTAFDPRNRQSDDDSFEGKTRSQESPPCGAPFGDLSGPATGTLKAGWVLFNGEDDLLSNVLRAPIPIAHDVQGMIQKAGGHALPSFQDFFKPRKDQACPLLFFNHTYANTG
jgi:hypothetical protein